MQVVSMVKLPGDVKSAIDGSYIDTVYLYAWGDFGVAQIYIDPRGFYPTKLDSNMQLIIAKPNNGSISVMDIKEDEFNPAMPGI